MKIIFSCVCDYVRDYAFDAVFVLGHTPWHCFVCGGVLAGSVLLSPVRSVFGGVGVLRCGMITGTCVSAQFVASVLVVQVAMFLSKVNVVISGAIVARGSCIGDCSPPCMLQHSSVGIPNCRVWRVAS